MSAGRGKGRRRGGGHEEHENEERWLLTYADMITLLMALFIVLFAMSSVNVSKYEELSKSLRDAFSGKILPGGPSPLEMGASSSTSPPTAQDPIPAIQPNFRQDAGRQSQESQKEEDEFKALKRRIDRIAEREGLDDQLQTEVARRGLVVRLLTDGVLFDSGSAALKPQAQPLIDSVARVLRADFEHPILVEGHTDDVPISGSQYPTNWELSAVRATSVVRSLLRGGVGSNRVGAAGYAERHPIETNETSAGRSRNRRVEVVLLRQGRAPTS